jgi:hypothetical protein
LRGVSHNFTESSQLLALLSDEQLGVANDVDQQNVTDLQLDFFSGHVTNAAWNRARAPQGIRVRPRY